MPELPTIRRIRTIRKVGIFHEFRADAELPEFKRYNLVYGFNGTGKTTISRLLRSLDAGDLQSALPTEGRIDLELSDGRVITPDQNTDAVTRRILVFNMDFVNENLRWSEGRANPVFYIGKDASRRAELLERVERRIPIRDAHRQHAESERRNKERALDTFHTDKARLIAEMLALGRRYDARHMKQDYESGAIAMYRALSEDEANHRKRLIGQSEAYAKLSLPELDPEALEAVLREARRISESTISGMALQELQDHPSMIPWVKTGLDYHQDQNLKDCLLCGNELSAERIAALRGALDERFERFFAEIGGGSALVDEWRDTVQNLSANIPHSSALAASIMREYEDSAARLQSGLSAVRQALEEAGSSLSGKAACLNRSNWPERLADSTVLERMIEELRVSLGELRRFIERHNSEQDEFAQRQQQARDELKFSILIDHAADHEALRREADAAARSVEVRGRLHQKLTQRASSLRSEVRDHGPAVQRINALLHAYLGHAEIRLDVLEEGYRILRHGRAISGPLSEGERTAIALCYFLCKLQEEGRNVSEQIIVVDDPVSSLDAGALNYAFNLLKGRLQNARQLIVMTHNVAFMNETKKWMKRFRDRDGTASLFYLHAWQEQGSESRQAKLIEMPKLLRAYDSEYQYLFSLVRKCAEEGTGSPIVPGYIMPNVIRRVLELFLMFKIPSSEGLGDKINRPLVQNSGLDEGRIHAINTLAQVESHSENLDDFIGFSSMTLEETQNAAQAVLRLFELLDNDHYTRMWEISR